MVRPASRSAALALLALAACAGEQPTPRLWTVTCTYGGILAVYENLRRSEWTIDKHGTRVSPLIDGQRRRLIFSPGVPCLATFAPGGQET